MLPNNVVVLSDLTIFFNTNQFIYVFEVSHLFNMSICRPKPSLYNIWRGHLSYIYVRRVVVIMYLVYFKAGFTFFFSTNQLLCVLLMYIVFQISMFRQTPKVISGLYHSWRCHLMTCPTLTDQILFGSGVLIAGFCFIQKRKVYTFCNLCYY